MYASFDAESSVQLIQLTNSLYLCVVRSGIIKLPKLTSMASAPSMLVIHDSNTVA